MYLLGLMLELSSSEVQAFLLYSDPLTHFKAEFTEFGSRASTGTPSARSEAISELDKEIYTARARILSLRTRRNALAPIFLLPSKLLAQIFHFYALEGLSWSSGVTLGWISVTHVCRYWRQVALEDTSLWTRIAGFPQSTSWIAEMLLRSKCAPLTIDLYGPPDLDVLSMFPSHISHTRELRLRNLSVAHVDSIKELCCLEAPVLEHFELDMSDTPFPVIFHPLVGTKLFKDHAPKLRTFSLHHAGIPWSIIPRSQLTELRIILPCDLSDIDDIPLPNISQFIDVLTNSPALEDLVLQFCLPSMPSFFFSEQTIHLSHLSHLDLAGSGSSVANSLKMLKLPSLIKLHLRCVFDSAVAYNGGLFLPPILAPFKKPKRIVFKSFGLTVDYVTQSLYLILSSYLPPSTHHRTFGGCLKHDADYCLAIDMKFDIGHLSYTVERMSTLLPITEVELLYISASASRAAESVNWEELFRRCEKITTIEACGSWTTTLLPTLTPPKRVSTTFGGKGKKRRDDSRDLQAQLADNATAHVIPIFPNLTTLVLSKLDFSENVPRRGKLYDVLMNAIRRRRSYNAPLKSLTIEDCNISAKHRNALEKEVPRFRCIHERCMSFDGFDEYDYDPDSFEYGAQWGDLAMDAPVDWDDCREGYPGYSYV
jgi:hypothetical protein